MPRVFAAPLWVWAAALAPRLALWVRSLCEPGLAVRGDSLGYLALSRDILAPQTFRTPGYPLFLAPLAALLPDPVPAATLLQCLLAAAACAAVWRWAREEAGPRAAAAAALALAWDPVSVLHSPMVMAEPLFVLLLVLALRASWGLLGRGGAGRAAACGALWSAAALVKPIVLYLPGALAPLWLWRLGRREAAALLAAAYLLPAAWTARNAAVSGRAVFSSIGAHDLLRYPAAGVEALRTGRPHAEVEAELRARLDASRPGGWADDAEKAAAYGAEAARLIAARPLLLAQYCAGGAAKILAGTGLELLLEWIGARRLGEGDMTVHARPTGSGTLGLLRERPWLIPVEAAYLAFLAALYLLAASGAASLRKTNLPGAALLVLAAAYLLALSSTQGYYRYRIPLLPVLALLAAFSPPLRTPRPGADSSGRF